MSKGLGHPYQMYAVSVSIAGTQMYTKCPCCTPESITAWHSAKCHLRLSSVSWPSQLPVHTDNVLNYYIKEGPHNHQQQSYHQQGGRKKVDEVGVS